VDIESIRKIHKCRLVDSVFRCKHFRKPNEVELNAWINFLLLDHSLIEMLKLFNSATYKYVNVLPTREGICFIPEHEEKNKLAPHENYIYFQLKNAVRIHTENTTLCV